MLGFLMNKGKRFFGANYMELLPVKIFDKTHPRWPDYLKHTSFSTAFEVSVHTSELSNGHFFPPF